MAVFALIAAGHGTGQIAKELGICRKTVETHCEHIKLKLDWFFIKPANLTDPDDRSQPYLLAPRFGRTLKALNYSVNDRISDHNPMIVDLLLIETREPKLRNEGRVL